MASGAVAAEAAARRRHANDRPWWISALVLTAGTCGLAVLFRTEAMAAFGVWRESTAFGHCFLVGPIVAWLAWERRGRLLAAAPRPVPALALLALPLAAAWLAAERLGVMEWRQFAALFTVWLLVIAVLGFAAGRALAVPLAYSIFLVPFGAFLVPALQDFTASFIDVGLSLLDIPHVVTDTLIEIPEGAFRVAEACAGLRFLIAAIAFGALYACILYRSAWRRAGFVAVCIVVPVLANGVRAFAIVVLGHIRGSAEAGAVDHVVYGWVFFSVVIIMLLLMGLPFRQDAPVAAVRGSIMPGPGVGRPAILAAAFVALFAASGPAVAAWLAQRSQGDAADLAARAERVAAGLLTPQGCVSERDAITGHRRYVCGDATLDAQVQVMDRRSGPAVLAAWRRASDPPVAEAGDEGPDVSWQDEAGAQWRVVQTRHPPQSVAAALWLDQMSVADDRRLRVRLALDSLGPPRPATVVGVTASGAGGAQAVDAFIAAQRIVADCARSLVDNCAHEGIAYRK